MRLLSMRKMRRVLWYLRGDMASRAVAAWGQGLEGYRRDLVLTEEVICPYREALVPPAPAPNPTPNPRNWMPSRLALRAPARRWPCASCAMSWGTSTARPSRGASTIGPGLTLTLTQPN
jgi:hypothetical protein